MGGGYSKEEKIEAEKYIVKIKEAVGDNDRLEKYRRVRKELAGEIKIKQ
jgi:hypothetical protein